MRREIVGKRHFEYPSQLFSLTMLVELTRFKSGPREAERRGHVVVHGTANEVGQLKLGPLR